MKLQNEGKKPDWMSDSDYKQIISASLPGSGVSKADVQNMLANAVKRRYADEYGINDDQWNLIKPLIASGAYGEGEIAKYISDLLAAQQDREYNSPVADAARQRMAGVNPDLVGLGETPASQNPAAPDAALPLPSQGGKGTLHSRFAQISADVLQLATFGLNAYSVISSATMRTGMELAGFAEQDILSVAGNEKGMVDIPSIIAQGIQARGLSGNKAKRYAAEVQARANALPYALKRLNNAADYQEAQSRLKLGTFKNSDEYINQAIEGLRLQQQTDNKMKEIDLLEAQAKEKFLLDHPDYTADSLDAALRGEIAEANRKEQEAKSAESAANIAKTNEGKAIVEKQIADENLLQEKTKTHEDQQNSEVNDLKRTLQKLELEGIDEMLKYVRAYEEAEEYYRSHGQEWEFKHGKWDSPLMSYEHSTYNNEHWSKSKYDFYKATIAKYYEHNEKGSSTQVSVGAGPVKLGMKF